MLFLAINVFENIGKAAGTFGSGLRGIAWTIFAVAVIICGVAWVIGGRGAEFAKSTLGRVVVGVGVVALATAIISTLAQMYGGGGAKTNFKGGLKTMVEPLKLYLWSKGIFF